MNTYISDDAFLLMRAFYPGKRIVRIPEEDPKEAIVELGVLPGTKCGQAIAVIGESTGKHFHNKMIETYVLLDGELHVNVDGLVNILRVPGESICILPGRKHFASVSNGKPATVLVLTVPPWTKADHHIAV
jgi:quercetin dioxygenase-like cupin family protein